jgi:hypothetical protein
MANSATVALSVEKHTATEKDFGVVGHKQLDADKSLLALKLIVEGNSIRSAERITGLHRDTIASWTRARSANRCSLTQFTTFR